MLSHSVDCLLIAHIKPLCYSRANLEKDLYEGIFHAIIFRYFRTKSTQSIHLIRLLVFELLHQQKSYSAQRRLVLLSPNYAYSGLLMIKIRAPHTAHARPLLVPYSDSSSNSSHLSLLSLS
jgi:hypothetical protein